MFVEIISGRRGFDIRGEAACSCGPGAGASQVMDACNGPGNSAGTEPEPYAAQ